jgi:putative membrane protein
MHRISAMFAIVVLGAWAGVARADKETTPLDDNFLISAASCENAVIEISGLAAKIGVVAGLEKRNRDEYERLSKLNGADFDKAYMAWIIEGHKKEIANVENQTANGKNAEATQFAKAALPTMKQHLKQAEELNKSLGF